MSKIEVKLVCVQIQRNLEVINVTVPEHEVRILQAMHGPSNVRKVKELDPEVEVAELGDSPADELLRLERRYKHAGQQDSPVRLAYPNGERDLAAFGFTGSETASEVPQSETKVRKPAKKAAKKAEPSK